MKLVIDTKVLIAAFIARGIHNRLQIIYPEGIPNRNYCILETMTR